MKRSRLSPMSKKRRASLAERERVRLEVFQRDRYCQFFNYAKTAQPSLTAGELVDLPACAGPRTTHHLWKASAGGPYIPENLTTLCSFHNGFVEDEPDLCHRLGLVIRRGDPLPWEAA